jgi:nucleotide-binding universal stress UspA family protein
MRPSIVCEVDDSTESWAAAVVAVHLGRVLDRRLVLAHVVDPPSALLYPDVRERQQRRQHVIEEGFELLDDVAAGLPDPVGQRAVVLGTAAAGLPALCRDEGAALLVIGSRQRGRFAAALDGHATARQASKAACPVLVVPPHVTHRIVAGEHSRWPLASQAGLATSDRAGDDAVKALAV